MNFLLHAGVCDAAAITTDATAKPPHLAEALSQADDVEEQSPEADALAEPTQADALAELTSQADVVARVEQAGKKRKVEIEHTSQQVT